jgi:hypothetical protein
MRSDIRLEGLRLTVTGEEALYSTVSQSDFYRETGTAR